MPSEDELAETAAAPTATQTATVAAKRVVRVDDKQELGRFKLESILGAGGMGVVHAAFDPELERRVALKLLHASSPDARARLLREARAMAKLSHPNVITVFEVGSADGEDFVAMELVDGETLKEWQVRVVPPWREIAAAFIAAGRGLAAAHAAGLVHRDFKPSNVLRGHDGKIVVTDFGLSRAASDPEEPVPEDARSSGPTTKTETGAVLGTPAYMSPEQWTGGTVGPEADQYAFCVALWEALAGERPYHADSLDELRRDVLAGAGSLDADKLPRPLRAIVRRGLAKNPAQRWPSMTALLAALERATARRRRALVLVAIVAIGGAATSAYALTRRGGIDCPPPALDPEAVWSRARADAIASHNSDAAKLLGGELAVWRDQRDDACRVDAALRTPQLACLDGVLARFDVAARATERDGSPHGFEGNASILIDPVLCARQPTPHLTAALDPPLVAALELFRDARDGGRQAITAELAPPDAACARALGLRARIAARDLSTLEVDGLGALSRDVREASSLVDRCSDDALKAVVLIGVAYGSPNDLQRAITVTSAFPQEDLLAELDVIHGAQARAAAQLTDAIGIFDGALDRYARRHRERAQVHTVAAKLEALLARSSPKDLDEVDALVARWLPVAQTLTRDDVGWLELLRARARWHRGDVAAADAVAIGVGHIVRYSVNYSTNPLIAVTGIVVDEAGAPVADAEVVAAPGLPSDSAHVAAPLELSRWARTQSGPDGRFALPHARGLIAAGRGELRATAIRVAPEVKLVVRPTYRVRGTVALGTLAASELRIVASADGDTRYSGFAPVLANGAFELAGVPRGKLAITVGPYGTDPEAQKHLDVTGNVDGVALAAQAMPPLYVIARNTGLGAPDLGLVFVFTGVLPAKHATIGEIRREPFNTLEARLTARDAVPPAARERIQPDDLFTFVQSRPPGDLFICGIGVSRDLFSAMKTDTALKEALIKSELGCVQVGDDPVIVVELPPMRRVR